MQSKYDKPIDRTVRINTNLKLFQWQSDVIRNVKSYGKGYVHVIKSKRQCGKSLMLEMLLIQSAVEKPKSKNFCLSPTLDQARKIFKEIKNVLKPTKLYQKHNDIQLYMQLTNGSEFYFKSAEQRDALRGYTCNGIYVIDEAAYIPDDIFYDTLAWVNVSQAPVVICSTPYHKTGFFYKYYNMGLENGNTILTYDWCEYDTSELLSDEVLERYRREIPANKFKTEFLGQFLDSEGGVFGDYSGIISDDYEEGLNLYMGIDWGNGVGGDYTAIVIFNSKGEMVAVFYFNDKDETQTINYIIELMKKYKPLKCEVEINSIGQVFWGLLDKAIKANRLPVQLIRFTTSNESKERLINQFQVAIQNKTVTMLDNHQLKIQFDMYEMKINQNGKRIYNAAAGFHDDIVMATLFAYDCISRGSYCIR